MNRDDIIRMAREAGLGTSLTHDGGEKRVWIEGADWHAELSRFAALVAAAEREACAKVCEEIREYADGFHVKDSAFDRMQNVAEGAEECAAAIRARGEK